jgi:hypothetical protein
MVACRLHDDVFQTRILPGPRIAATAAVKYRPSGEKANELGHSNGNRAIQ